MEPAARHLVFHGTVILLVGLLCGAPYGRAINAAAATPIVRSWRVAHVSLPVGAILMFAGNALGAATSLLASLALIYAAFASL